MSWAKLDDQFFAHPKVRAAWDECPASIGLFTLALSYAAGAREKALNPGEVPDWLVRGAFSRPKDMKAAVNALVGNGLWDQADGHLVIHDFLEFNKVKDDDLEARRAADRDRQAAKRARDRAKVEETKAA